MLDADRCDELCITNDEFCIKQLMNFVLEMMNSVFL